MIVKRFVLNGGVFGLLVMIGCSAVTSGRAVVSYEKGEDFILTEAPQDGAYALYDIYVGTKKGSFNLMKGSKLGFEGAAGGQVTAVAGRDRIKLNDGHYVWKLK